MKRSIYWWAFSKVKPVGKVSPDVQWLPAFVLPPRFFILYINESGEVSDDSIDLSRGAGQAGPDWVCWVNLGTQPCKIKFADGDWPFKPAKPWGAEFVIPPSSPSAWYQLSPSSGAPGQKVPYPYAIDVGPGPPGPEIVSDD